jgi:hypothetical protein
MPPGPAMQHREVALDVTHVLWRDAAIADTDWVCQVALFAAADTVKDRTRWRLRGKAPESHPYGFLWTGRRSGAVQVS